MPFKLVMVPPNTQPDWPEKIRAAVPDCNVQLFGSAEAAMEAIVDADAAYGNIVPELFRRAKKLRWIQAPAAAPQLDTITRSSSTATSSSPISARSTTTTLAPTSWLLSWPLRAACSTTSRSSSIASGKDRAWRHHLPARGHRHDRRCRRYRRRSSRLCAAFGMTVLGLGPTF